MSKNPRVDFEVRSLEAERVLKQLGQVVGEACPPGYGFSLMIFDFEKLGSTGAMFYISNANREDMINAMQEFIKKFREN